MKRNRKNIVIFAVDNRETDDYNDIVVSNMRQCAFFVRPQTDKRRRREGSLTMQQAEGTRLAAGMRQTQRLIAAGKAHRVLIALDADAAMRQKARALAQAAGIPAEDCESMELLGRRCRIAVPCAVAAEEKGE